MKSFKKLKNIIIVLEIFAYQIDIKYKMHLINIYNGLNINLLSKSDEINQIILSIADYYKQFLAEVMLGSSILLWQGNHFFREIDISKAHYDYLITLSS